MRLSATLIKTYLRCPRQYRYVYVDEIPLLPTDALAFGKVLHQVLHSLHLASMAPGTTLDLELALAEFDRRWAEIIEREDPWFRDGEQAIERYQTLGHKMLRDYVAVNQDASRPLVLEHSFELPWGEHILCGVIDRVDERQGCLTVVDYKTGKRKPTKREIDIDLQLTIYSYAAEQVFGLPARDVEYYHLRDQTVLTTWRDGDDFTELLDDVLPHVVAAIEAEEFAPKPGYWCRFCDFRGLCQAEGLTLSPLAARRQSRSALAAAASM
jgi:putative RecB family exonuclease